MRRPKLLDLFCGAGGAAMGYSRAGFEVVGVDIKPQPHYPFKFHQADAFEFLEKHGHKFDVFHASPPCQGYSRITPMAHKAKYPDLIAPIRKALQVTGKPFIIENVPDARRLLKNPVMLCGSMFGLNIFRHRYFEISPRVFMLTPSCNHFFHPVLITGCSARYLRDHGRQESTADDRRAAIKIPWMTKKELDDAIPPDYTKFIGNAILEAGI